MSKLELSILNIKSEKEVAQFEKALYRAFSYVDIATWGGIYDFDIAKERLKPKIPYRSQEIYVAKLRGAIVAGAAINFNIREKLQLEMIGFSINKTEKHICEGLAVFNLQIYGGMKFIAPKLRDYCYESLKLKLIRRLYATCSQKRLRGYELLGFQAIDILVFKGEKKYLLATELQPT